MHQAANTAVESLQEFNREIFAVVESLHMIKAEPSRETWELLIEASAERGDLATATDLMMRMEQARHHPEPTPRSELLTDTKKLLSATGNSRAASVRPRPKYNQL